MREYYRKNTGCRIWAFSVMGAVFSAVAVGLHRKEYAFLVSERNDPLRYEHPHIRNFFIVMQTGSCARRRMPPARFRGRFGERRL